MTKTLSPEEAEEYTKNLGSVAVGNYGLMEFAMHTLQVPKALGMSNEDWVQEKLGGYIRWSVEQRREAVRELSGEQTGEGNNVRYARSAKSVAEILGISEQTVKRDRDVIAALENRDTPQKALSATPESREKALTVEEQRPKIRKLIDAGKSNAEIAVAMDRGVATISKERTAYAKEKDPGMSEGLKQAKARKKAALDAIPEAERKAREAKFDEFVSDFKKSFSQASGVFLRPLAQELHLEMGRIMDNDLDISDYDDVVTLVLETANELWVYGAKRGHDVSRIAEILNRLGGGETA